MSSGDAEPERETEHQGNAARVVPRRRTIGAAVLLGLIPVAMHIPALASLALVGLVCAAIVAYEAVRYRESRWQVRHPELIG